jgi:transcriptional/translational regulatory protein YebC/TACO1
VLESVVVECIGPESVAMVIDCQTDNKLRALQDVRSIIKSHNGTTTPIGYMFSKRGRVVFEKHDDLGLDDVLDSAIDAGADDVDIQPDGSIVVRTLWGILGLKLRWLTRAAGIIRYIPSQLRQLLLHPFYRRKRV